KGCDFHWQKKENTRHTGAAPVMVNTWLEIDEASFAQSMAKIKIADRIDVPARIVNTPVADREWAKQIEEAGHEIAQTRTQIQGIGRGNNRESAGVEDSKDLAQKIMLLLEVVEGFDAGDETKENLE